MSRRIISLLRNYNTYREVPSQTVGDAVIFDFDDEGYEETLNLQIVIKRLYKNGKLTKKDIDILEAFIWFGTYKGAAEYLGIGRAKFKKILIKLSDIIADEMGEEYTDEYLNKLLEEKEKL